ncbi:MAG: galactose-1-phosphate uridylyltransferase [Planctomycetota bacterium]
MTWEERWHPLREEWVIVSAHRMTRPWAGAVHAPGKTPPPYDPACHFCPGNARIGGERNPAYTGIFAFDNDHPCVGDEAPRELERPPGILRNRPAEGVARVVCYHPRHDLTMAEMTAAEIRGVLDEWARQYEELGARPEVAHVLVFENKGEAVGVSNPHPHCQIYATNFVFKTIAEESRISRAHLAATGRVLGQDVIAAEEADGRRIVADRGSAVAFVPHFARLPYEVFVMPRATHPSLASLSAGERDDLAAVMREVLVRYDNLWRMSFPYVLTLHQAPTGGGDHAGFHFHLEYHAMLRQPTLLKFLAGPELGGGSFLNDASPEEKAAELRAAETIHYKHAETAR